MALGERLYTGVPALLKRRFDSFLPRVLYVLELRHRLFLACWLEYHWSGR
jgi:hypothetical protein